MSVTRALTKTHTLIDSEKVVYDKFPAPKRSDLIAAQGAATNGLET